MKTVRTVRRVEENDFSTKAIGKEPKYKIGQSLEVYFGSHEGCRFKVLDIRYNFDDQYSPASYEYLMSGLIFTQWYREGALTT